MCIVHVQMIFSISSTIYFTSSQIYCEFAYFDEIDKLLIPVGCLHLSETSTATLEHINMDSSISSVENKNIEDVHARIWCITIIGLERSDEGPEDG